MMITYLDQIQSHAKACAVDPREACKAEGIALTTWQRWINGKAFPREQTARVLIERITAMSSSLGAA